MLPKLVWRLVPALVLRYVLVKSMNPIGVMRVSPIFNVKGAVVASGEEGAVAGSFWGGTTDVGTGAAGSGGTIGARLATSPTLFGVGAGSAGAAGGAVAVAATSS